MSPKQQNTLNFLDNPTKGQTVSIKADNYDWDFTYKIAKSLKNSTQLSQKKIVQIPLSGGRPLFFEDDYKRSDYCFSIPYQFLSFLYCKRKEEVQQSSCPSVQKQKHLVFVKAAMSAIKSTVVNEASHYSLGYRPPALKKDPIFQFLPINLFEHNTKIRYKDFQSPQQFHATTFGAPSAHYFLYFLLFFFIFFFPNQKI